MSIKIIPIVTILKIDKNVTHPFTIISFFRPRTMNLLSRIHQLHTDINPK